MGELEERLKATPPVATKKSPIQDAMEKAEVQAAADLLSAQARRRTAEEQLRAEEVENKLHGGKEVKTEERQPPTKTHWLVVNGQVIKDLDEGTMTLSEALQVAAAQKAETKTDAKLGWEVVNGKVMKTPDGTMTISEAIQLAKLERDEEGAPEVKQLLKALVQKDIEAKDAQIKTIQEQNSKILEVVTNAKVNSGSNTLVRNRIFTPDKTAATGWRADTFEPGDTVFIPPPPSEPVKESKSEAEIQRELKERELTIKEEHSRGMVKAVADGLKGLADKAPTIAAAFAGRGKGNTSDIVIDKCEKCGADMPHKYGVTEVWCPKCNEHYTAQAAPPADATPQPAPQPQASPSGSVLEL